MTDDALPESEPPREFDEYTVILLVRPEGAPQLDDAEADLLQRQHLGHLSALRSAGHLLASGPFDDPPDDTWRGLCLYSVSVVEALKLAQRDPAVLRGRLVPVAFQWRTRKGDLHPA
jgi:uncharacterized protein YciI